MGRQKRADKHTVYFELRDACRESGCPVCTVTLNSVARYLDGIIYESVNVPPIRDAVIAARGYCNTHSWQVREMRAGAGFGMALMYRDVVRHVAESIADAPSGAGLSVFPGRQASSGPGVFGRLAALTGGNTAGTSSDVADPHADCPACLERSRAEALYLGAALDHAGEEEFAEALRAAGGLCLVHLDRVIGLRGGSAALKRLLAIQRAAMLALHEDLSEYIRKHDYRFVNEKMGAEGDSWVRSINLVAGKQGIR